MLMPNASKAAHGANGTGSSGNCGSVSVGFPITMMVTGMVGNSLALILVYISYRKKENKRKRSFLLCIGSLALTDLFGQLLTSPIVISVYRADLSWERVDPGGYLCPFFGMCMTTFGLCALFLASAMATERAAAVTSPHWYSRHMNTRVTQRTLALIWALGLLFALLPVVGVGRYTRQWPGTWCFISVGDSQVSGNVFFSVTFAVLGIFSLLVTVSCNVVTIRSLVIRCRSKTGSGQSSRQWERLTTETIIQLLGIMCVLLICWSPLLVTHYTIHTNIYNTHKYTQIYTIHTNALNCTQMHTNIQNIHKCTQLHTNANNYTQYTQLHTIHTATHDAHECMQVHTIHTNAHKFTQLHTNAHNYTQYTQMHATTHNTHKCSQLYTMHTNTQNAHNYTQPHTHTHTAHKCTHHTIHTNAHNYTYIHTHTHYADTYTHCTLHTIHYILYTTTNNIHTHTTHV